MKEDNFKVTSVATIAQSHKATMLVPLSFFNSKGYKAQNEK
jgi:hypothetical protein